MNMQRTQQMGGMSKIKALRSLRNETHRQQGGKRFASFTVKEIRLLKKFSGRGGL